MVDNRTLAQSPNLPLAFLRGVGLSDWEIETTKLHQRNLSAEDIHTIGYAIIQKRVGQPMLQFYSCFISYSHQDEEFAKRLCADLQDNGVRCWFSPADGRAGVKLFPQIDEAIRVHDKLLLILSPDSMNSQWVKVEIAKARQRELQEGGQLLFPTRLVDFEAIKLWECLDSETGKDLASEIREYLIPDFSDWKSHDAYEEAFQRLLRDLSDEKN